MKIAAPVVVALIACSAAWATPPPWAAKAQLPAQANGTPPSKAESIIPPPPILPPPPPILPPILAGFTSGQTAQTTQTQQAAAAVDAATVTVKAKLASATNISVITMTATQRALRKTRLSPAGRAGDLEQTRWGFTDRYGHRIGEGNTLCRWATVSRRLCWGEVRLPLGRLVVLGSSQTRVLGEFAVIGGTGRYLFKQGLLVFRQLSTSKYAIRVLLA